MDKTAIRDAATLIVLRDAATTPAVLMGQRGASAAFMPGKFVFPGGAVDANDANVPTTSLDPSDNARLSSESAQSPVALAAAAIRELWEETGQVLGAKQAWSAPHKAGAGSPPQDMCPMPQHYSFSFAR